jgi:hypothetical protein
LSNSTASLSRSEGEHRTAQLVAGDLGNAVQGFLGPGVVANSARSYAETLSQLPVGFQVAIFAT